MTATGIEDVTAIGMGMAVVAGAPEMTEIEMTGGIRIVGPGTVEVERTARETTGETGDTAPQTGPDAGLEVHRETETGTGVTGSSICVDCSPGITGPRRNAGLL